VHSDRAAMIASVGRRTCVWAWDSYFGLGAAHDGSLGSVKNYFYMAMVVLDLVHFRGSEVRVEYVLPSTLVAKRTEICPKFTRHSPTTPLYEHRLANAGEYKMSRKIESTGGTCLALQALLTPMPKLAFLTDSFRVTMAE